MGRAPRVDVGNGMYHIINRANARLQLFFKEKDYKLLESIIKDGAEKFDTRVIAYCIMPNHFHLVVWTREDGELQKYMQWVTLTHTQRWHVQNKTTGHGHLYQGRYKSFIIEDDKHLFTVMRYVERNPLRAKLVKNLSNWKYSSFVNREDKKTFVTKPPISLPGHYNTLVHTPLTANEIDSVRYSVNKGKPFGTEAWTDGIIDKYKLHTTVRGRGRPKKGT